MRTRSTAGRVVSLGAAALLLCAVRLALACLPFAIVSRGVERFSRTRAWLPHDAPRRVGERVARLARHVPGAACLAQALTTRVLLAWHGYHAVVRYGVRPAADGMVAHAWVEHAGEVVAGGPDVTAYVALEPTQTRQAR